MLDNVPVHELPIGVPGQLRTPAEHVVVHDATFAKSPGALEQSVAAESTSAMTLPETASTPENSRSYDTPESTLAVPDDANVKDSFGGGGGGLKGGKGGGGDGGGRGGGGGDASYVGKESKYQYLTSNDSPAARLPSFHTSQV